MKRGPGSFRNVHAGRFFFPPVPQKFVDPLQLLAVVAAIPLEGEFAALTGMAEIELDRAVGFARLGRPNRHRDDNAEQKTNRQPDA